MSSLSDEYSYKSMFSTLISYPVNLRSSRLIVKGLPKHADSKRLRDHFATFCEVTDAKVMTRDGVTRRFGFVGYPSEKQAKAAKRHFDQTYMDTSKLSVEVALKVGDEAIPRPWSKYSEGSSGHRKAHPIEKEVPAKLKAREAKKLAKQKYKVGTGVDDEQLKEFLEVSGNRSKTKLWEDNAASGLVAKMKGKAEVLTVANKKPGGQGLAVNRTKITFGSESEDDEAGSGSDSDEYDEMMPEKKEVRDDGVSDMDYLRSKVGTFSDDEDNADDESEEEEVKGAKEKRKARQRHTMEVDEEATSDEDAEEQTGISGDEKEPEDEATLDSILEGKTVKNGASPSQTEKNTDIDGDSEEEVGESGRLFVRNLPYSCGEDELTALFKKHGPIAECHIVIDRETKRSKGTGYVLFMVPEHAVKAMDKLDGSIFQGRLIHVLPARTKKVYKKDSKTPGHLSTYKASKEAKRKEDAASDHNWNTLFLQQDAVVDAMTEEYGVEKSEILDPTASSMAVRVALGETRAIADTKTFLEEHGVSVESFLADGAKLKARSKTVILAKNIPSVATETDLRSLFTKHGSVARVVMPPSKVMALVEFYEPSEARSAFKSLAYRPFKHTPLYL